MKITEHALERIMERLETMTSNNDITEEESEEIKRNLNNIINYEFNNYSSYGIMFGKFNINLDSNLLTEKHKTGTYYEINSLDDKDVIRDSTGNEFWGIIRSNKLVTAFLRKTIQRHTAEKPRNHGGLGVEQVIDDFDNF